MPKVVVLNELNTYSETKSTSLESLKNYSDDDCGGRISAINSQ